MAHRLDKSCTDCSTFICAIKNREMFILQTRRTFNRHAAADNSRSFVNLLARKAHFLEERNVFHVGHGQSQAVYCGFADDPACDGIFEIKRRRQCFFNLRDVFVI
jgi:hypothetical protein